MRRFLAVLGIAIPVFAQYAGPAILSRGDSPSATSAPEINFRPFVEVDGVYNTGLSGVSVNSEGNIANQAAFGVEVAGGIGGLHRWRHTEVGLSYRGSFFHYFGKGAFDNTNQTLLLGIRHQLNRRVALTLNNSFGLFNRDYGLLSTISTAVPFDPAQTYVPTTDFFNNRTIFAASEAGLTIQRSARLSIRFAGGLFINRRASSALYGVTGITASGDMEYRLTRRMTVGGTYNFAHYLFTGLINSTDMNGGSGTLAYQLTRWWEFTGYGGFMRVETRFVQSVAVDPTVAAIIGITESSQVVYGLRYIPDLGARISRTFHRGVLYGKVSHGITPGNGLFLTSDSTNVGGGYTYTGLRKWSFGANVNYMTAQSIGNVLGNYGGTSFGVNASRQLAHSIHIVAGGTMFRYNSSDFSKYNETVYSAHIGIGWTPGAVPLRIW